MIMTRFSGPYYDYYGAGYNDPPKPKPKSPTQESCQYCPSFTVSGKRLYCSSTGNSIVLTDPLPVRCREKLRLSTKNT